MYMKESKIKSPVIIIGCPRSGTSLLLTILSTSPHLWSLYRETIDIWERFYRDVKKEFKNDLLSESDLNEESKDFLLTEFHKYSFNNYSLGYLVRESLNKKGVFALPAKLVADLNNLYKNTFINEYRFVEKSPKSCFRIPFINKLFDKPKFIFLKRDGRSNINSLIEGWKLPKKYTRPEVANIPLKIKGYPDLRWRFVLPPGWENYKESSIEEVCAFQWTSSNKAAMESLKSIEKDRKYTISYEELTEDPSTTIKNLCNFIDIPFSESLKKIANKLPSVNYITKPKKDKWKQNISLIEKTYPTIEPLMKELGYN